MCPKRMCRNDMSDPVRAVEEEAQTAGAPLVPQTNRHKRERSTPCPALSPTVFDCRAGPVDLASHVVGACQRERQGPSDVARANSLLKRRQRAGTALYGAAASSAHAKRRRQRDLQRGAAGSTAMDCRSGPHAVGAEGQPYYTFAGEPGRALPPLEGGWPVGVNVCEHVHEREACDAVAAYAAVMRELRECGELCD